MKPKEKPKVVYTQRDIDAAKREWERTVAIAKSFEHIFAGHTCFMPLVGWRSPNGSRSKERQNAQKNCPRCQTGDLLPYYRSQYYEPKPLEPAEEEKPMGPKEGTWRWKRMQPRELCKNGCGRMSELYSESCTGDFCSRSCANAFATKSRRTEINEKVRESLRKRHQEKVLIGGEEKPVSRHERRERLRKELEESKDEATTERLLREIEMLLAEIEDVETEYC